MMFDFLTIFTLFAFLFFKTSASPTFLPTIGGPATRQRRTTQPSFPSSPPSCPLCAQGYPNIQGCAEAAPVLANFSMVIFNPGAFIDVIKCACTDTFSSVFPQCVDCFIQTNQTDVLDTSDLPGIVADIRKICALESTLLGNVSAVDATLTGTNAPSPSSTSWGVITRRYSMSLTVATSVMGMGILAGHLRF